MNKTKIKSFKLSDQIFFAQRLLLLLNSGISMTEALSMMKNMEKNIHRKYIYELLIKNIQEGVSLGKSIRNLRIKFNDLLVVLIQNGEVGGNLADALSQAYLYLEKKNEMKKKIVSSLIYPTFIVIATIAMTLFLILYIFPKIIPLLGTLDIKLPLITRIVQGLYNFMVFYGIWACISVVLIFVVSNILIKKNKKVRYKIDTLLLRTPFISTYIKTYIMSHICVMGEMLLTSGKGIPDMMIFFQDSSSNMVYKKTFGEIYIESTKGVSLSVSISKYSKFFPSILSDMCALGEKTGSLGLMLGHCSRIFEGDIDNILKKFTSLIEPILMVFMGLIVGSVALSIILPVYEITNHLSK